MMKRLFAAIAVMFLAVAPVAAQGTVSGTVTDASDMSAIEHAWLTARSTAPTTGGGMPWGGWFGNFTVSDAMGAYDFSLAAGNYDIRCRKWGYVSQTANVDVTDMMTTTQDFALAAPTFGTVTGTVTDADTLLPIEGARISLRPVTASGTFSWFGRRWAITDAMGVYTIDDVRTGDYELSARKHGYESSTPVAVTVTDGVTSTVDVALSPPTTGDLSVTVNDNMGAAVDGAYVFGRRDGGGWGWFAFSGGNFIFGQTDPMGLAEFTDIRTGDWTVHAGLPGVGRSSADVTVNDGMTTTVTIALP